jgi:glycerophosphoryl diester phosphodiesterase
MARAVLPGVAALPQTLRERPVAHRALHCAVAGRPENSRAAVAAAVEAGYGIEIDVQLSADGRAMVFHDETLDRLTGESGPLVARDAAELGAIRLRHSREGIPRLGEILALVAGRVGLLIELKDPTGDLDATDGRLEAAVAAELAGYDGPVAVMSFNPAMVARMGALLPGVARGLTTSAYDPDDWAPLAHETCDRLRAIPDYESTGAAFLSHEWTDLGRARVRELVAGGAALLCWTVRTPEAAARAQAQGANITFEGFLP